MIALLPGENPTARYAEEILAHAGIPFRRTSLKRLSLAETPLCVLVGTKRLSAEEREQLRWFVREGGCLLAVGATNGLDDLFGVRCSGELTEGWLRFGCSHPIGSDWQSSLHVFGGAQMTATHDCQVIAQVVDRKGDSISDAITLREVGEGLVVLIAPDIVHSIVHIQQGIAVVKDGVPAPDGSAPINDGILKAEDGHVLDWERDRIAMEHGTEGTGQGMGKRWVFFGQPITDELRALLLQAIFFAAQRKKLPLPMVWYWQRGAPAVGLISHDTDGNEPELGWELLSVVRQLGIATTWCVLYPGGYPPSLYRAILEGGCEIVLHFDAFTGTSLRSWSKRNLQVQWQWLKEATGVAAVSNKNHYTRWKGRLEFFRWCAELGIRAEQSKGPSKSGSVGFLFGGSHPWRPLDDEKERPRFLPVVEINLFSQDMVSDSTSLDNYFHPANVPVRIGKSLLQQTVRMGGVAHFLFHPAHIRRPGTKEALTELVTFGCELGVEWQTSAQIVDWLEQRRSIDFKAVRTSEGWTVVAKQLPREAQLLVLQPPDPLSGERIRFVYGFPFALWQRPSEGGKFLGRLSIVTS